MKISSFGDEYTHTYAAASALFNGEIKALNGVVFCDTVYSTLDKVRTGECDAGIVPIENSFEGPVTATEDALRELGLYIVAETVLPIKQNLIALNGVELKSIKKVYSHPQAIAQCRQSLSKLLPNAEIVPVAYTSAGLNMLSDCSAAIARSPKSGQTVIAEGIEDSGENCTRFIKVMSSARRSGNKVSVAFLIPNKPGALLEALQTLSNRGLNMVKIESRPSKRRMGQYVFYIDFIFPESDAELGSVLDSLSDKTAELQFLGRYAEFTQ